MQLSKLTLWMPQAPHTHARRNRFIQNTVIARRRSRRTQSRCVRVLDCFTSFAMTSYPFTLSQREREGYRRCARSFSLWEKDRMREETRTFTTHVHLKASRSQTSRVNLALVHRHGGFLHRFRQSGMGVAGAVQQTKNKFLLPAKKRLTQRRFSDMIYSLSE